MDDSPEHSPSSSARILWLLGALLVLPAVYFAARYPLFGNADDLADIGLLSAYGIPELIGYLAGLLALFAGYAGAIYILRGQLFTAVRGPVLCTSAALLLGFGILYPVNAIDLFIYAVRSHLLTEYRLNPNAVEPAGYWDIDPYTQFASRQWSDTVSPYGPLWNMLASPATVFDGDEILVALIIFKFLAIGCALATAWLIYNVVRAERPKDAAAAVVVYLWNPLLLWEGIGNGHNDVMVMLPVIAAIWCWRRGHDRWVFPLVVTSILIKYVTALLLPIALVVLWQRYRHRPAAERWRLVIWSVSLSLAVTYLALFPFFDLEALRESAEQQSGIFLASLGAAVFHIANLFSLSFPAERWVQGVGSATMATIVMILLVRLARGRMTFERALFEAMFTLLLVATWNFRPWYIIWLVALAALLPIGWPLFRTVAWGAGALLAYAHYIWVREVWPWDRTVFFLVGIAIAFMPVLAVTLAEAVAPLVMRRFVQQPARPMEPLPDGKNAHAPGRHCPGA